MHRHLRLLGALLVVASAALPFYTCTSYALLFVAVRRWGAYVGFSGLALYAGGFASDLVSHGRSRVREDAES